MLVICKACNNTRQINNFDSTRKSFCSSCNDHRFFVPASPDRRYSTREAFSISSDRKLYPKPSLTDYRFVKAAVHPDGKRFSAVSQPEFEPCEYFRLCLEFLLLLEIPKRHFNRSHNRCFCNSCYLPEKKDWVICGDRKYVIPRGWVRFGLYIDDVKAKVDKIWEKWIVSYHGTKPETAKSIVTHGVFLIPGDKPIGGDVIRVLDGHIPGKCQIYTSPTMAYSGIDTYATPTKFRSSNGHSYVAKLAFQCRQNPGTFKIQRETVGADTRRLCPIIPNEELEYFTEIRSSIIPYGILIHVSKFPS